MNNIQTIMSNGMGVESAAIQLRWIMEPETRPCPLEDLIVITSQTGDEYRDTLDLMTVHLLPLYRKHNIRYVQVARKGHLEADGYTVLDDSRAPVRMYGEGDYKLSDELRISGTVPQIGGDHICSQKFKAFVIESWIADHVTSPVKHAFGYSADEPKRVAKSEEGIAKRNAKSASREAKKRKLAALHAAKNTAPHRIAFGYSVDEPTRVAKAAEYDIPTRQGFYPLVEWNWTRQDCLDYIQRILGVTWKKSACVYCPYAHNKQNLAELAERHAAHPLQVADAMLLERCALALNPRSTFYSTQSLIDITVAADNKQAVGAYWDALQTSGWAVYRVRRIYSAIGQAKRCVEKLTTHATRTEAIQAVRVAAARQGRAVETKRAIEYVYAERREQDVYPTVEDYIVAAPSRPQTKAHPTVGHFERAWAKHQQAAVMAA